MTLRSALFALACVIGAWPVSAQDANPPSGGGFSASDVQVLYGWSFNEPGLSASIGSHGDCAAQVLSQPQLKLDLSSFWPSEGTILGFLGGLRRECGDAGIIGP